MYIPRKQLEDFNLRTYIYSWRTNYHYINLPIQPISNTQITTQSNLFSTLKDQNPYSLCVKPGWHQKCLGNACALFVPQLAFTTWVLSTSPCRCHLRSSSCRWSHRAIPRMFPWKRMMRLHRHGRPIWRRTAKGRVAISLIDVTTAERSLARKITFICTGTPSCI